MLVQPTLELDGMEPHYFLEIEGDPSFKVDIAGMNESINIAVSTVAAAVNWIPHVIKAKPGILTKAEDYVLTYCLPEKPGAAVKIPPSYSDEFLPISPK